MYGIQGSSIAFCSGVVSLMLIRVPNLPGGRYTDLFPQHPADPAVLPSIQHDAAILTVASQRRPEIPETYYRPFAAPLLRASSSYLGPRFDFGELDIHKFGS